jgi:2-polyprenyl-3-methyl-5-hydroxy-6-metoxy-1,4-benzoquinol methylase
MKKIIDLGMHPFADTFIKEDQLGECEPIYPLVCCLDEHTGLVKLKYETSANSRYNLYDYSYTSANSKFSRDHWKSFASETSLLYPKAKKILEIGSNDGFLLEQFKKKGFDVLGVDSSRKMAEIAYERGIHTIAQEFDSHYSKGIKNTQGVFDLVIANNVFNHANDPLDFAEGVYRVLSDNGTFIFEVPYWYNTIVDKRFDQIYHEHVSYFTVKSAVELLKKAKLIVNDVKIVDYHGGSIRVSASKNKSVNTSPEIENLIYKEEKEGLFKPERYKRFMKEIKCDRAKFLKNVYHLKSNGVPIIGIGAAAKGNTFLNFYNLDSTVLDYVTDASDHKIGKYTPLTRIKITSDNILSNYNKISAMVLSWNISDIIKEKLKSINQNIDFLEPNK